MIFEDVKYVFFFLVSPNASAYALKRFRQRLSYSLSLSLSLYIYIYIGRKLSLIQQEEKKCNREEHKETHELLRNLWRVWLEQVVRQWRRGSFPNLGVFCRLCKLSKFIGCSIVFPFQMMKVPVAEGQNKRAKDSIEDVAKCSISRPCIDGLYNG